MSTNKGLLNLQAWRTGTSSIAYSFLKGLTNLKVVFRQMEIKDGSKCVLDLIIII